MLQFLKDCEYLKLSKKQMEHYFGDAMKVGRDLRPDQETVNGSGEPGRGG